MRHSGTDWRIWKLPIWMGSFEGSYKGRFESKEIIFQIWEGRFEGNGWPEKENSRPAGWINARFWLYWSSCMGFVIWVVVVFGFGVGLEVGTGICDKNKLLSNFAHRTSLINSWVFIVARLKIPSPPFDFLPHDASHHIANSMICFSIKALKQL